MTKREREARERLGDAQIWCELHHARFVTCSRREQEMRHWANYTSATKARSAALAALLRVVREEARNDQ